MAGKIMDTDNREIDHACDPLFLGLTRPAMIWGISYEAFIVCMMTSIMVFLGVGNPFYMLVYVPMHAVCYAICMRDPRAFRLLALWVQTKGKSNSRNDWGGTSTSSPFYNTRFNSRQRRQSLS